MSHGQYFQFSSRVPAPPPPPGGPPDTHRHQHVTICPRPLPCEMGGPDPAAAISTQG